jgi:hypothetical protein
LVQVFFRDDLVLGSVELLENAFGTAFVEAELLGEAFFGFERVSEHGGRGAV